MVTRPIFCCVLALLLQLPAPLQAQDSKARPLFVKGRYLAQKKGDCLRALVTLEQARDLARSAKLRGHILLSMAQCYLLLGDDDQAAKNLRQALIHTPLITQYASRFKPDMQLLFKEVQRGVGKKPPASGSLSVVSVTKGAVVLVDGEEVGVVPFMGRVTEGKHRVVVRTRDGRRAFSQSIVVVRGSLVNINATLKKVLGTLSVRSDPTGGRVYVDKEIIGSTPVTETPLPPGSYTVSVRKDGFKTTRRKIEIKPNKLTSLTVTLEQDALLAGGGYTTNTRPRRIIWTWVAAGGALAALVTGVGLGLSIKNTAEDYAATPESQTERLDELEGSMRREAVGANVMFGVSGALLAASVVLFFWEAGWFDRERRPTGLSPTVGNGAAGLQWTVNF